MSWCSTRERFQEGKPLQSLDLSLLKLSNINGRISLLSAMADLLGCSFLSWNRYSRKSAIEFIGGGLKFT